MDIPKFVRTTSTKYNALTAKNADAVYLLTDTRELMLGGLKMVPTGFNPKNDVSVYASPTGNDSNDGLSQDKPMQTINNIMIKYGYCTNLRIFLMDGVYEGNSLSIAIAGKLTITSLSGTKTKSILNYSLFITQGIIDIKNISITSTASQAIHLMNVQGGSIANCIINCQKSVNDYGIAATENSNIIVRTTTINNAYIALRATGNSTINCISLYPSDNGENDNLFNSEDGSTIIKPNEKAIDIKTGSGENSQVVSDDSICIKTKDRNPVKYLDPNSPTTIYLSPTGNDDKNGTLTSPMKTIRGAIAKYGYCTNLTLSLLDGTYEDIVKDAPIDICNTGKVQIVSKNSNPANCIINHSIIFKYGNFLLSNVTVNTSSGAYNLTVLTEDACGLIFGCRINGKSRDTAYGIYTQTNSVVSIQNTTINNCITAISAYMNSTVYCNTIYTNAAGTENKKFYSAQTGSTIYKSSNTMKTISGIESDVSADSSIISLQERNPLKYLNSNNSITIYLSPTGDDSNNGIASASPMKTIKAAIEKWGWVARLVLYLAPGEYNDSIAYINIFCSGNLTINAIGGNNTNTIINHRILFYNGIVNLYNVTINGQQFGLDFKESKFTMIGCIVNTSSVGIDCTNSSGIIETSEINGGTLAVRAQRNSNITCINLTSTVINQTAFQSNYGSSINIHGSTPKANTIYYMYKGNIYPNRFNISSNYVGATLSGDPYYSITNGVVYLNTILNVAKSVPDGVTVIKGMPAMKPFSHTLMGINKSLIKIFNTTGSSSSSVLIGIYDTDTSKRIDDVFHISLALGFVSDY